MKLICISDLYLANHKLLLKQIVENVVPAVKAYIFHPQCRTTRGYMFLSSTSLFLNGTNGSRNYENERVPESEVPIRDIRTLPDFE